jgi:hypothetical protein
MKPLARWTIGPCRPEGFDILKWAIYNFKNLYPQFDCIICHNQLTKEQLAKVKNIGVELCDQEKYLNSNLYPPKDGYNVHWKLYPPRLRTESHELIMDNDIIFWKHINEIDSFLSNSIPLISQALRRSYGRYNHMVPRPLCINSGIIGLPPDFDFKEDINELLNRKGGWLGRNKDFVNFDEQGIVAVVLSKNEHYIIPTTTVSCLPAKGDLAAVLRNPMLCGIHFIGMNYLDHQWWKFKKNYLSLSGAFFI